MFGMNVSVNVLIRFSGRANNLQTTKWQIHLQTHSSGWVRKASSYCSAWDRKTRAKLYSIVILKIQPLPLLPDLKQSPVSPKIKWNLPPSSKNKLHLALRILLMAILGRVWQFWVLMNSNENNKRSYILKHF